MTNFQDRLTHLDGTPVGGETWLMGVENFYFVDGTNGASGNNGLSWDNAMSTIQAAITASNATIDWTATPKRYNCILVAPGVYAENLTPAYYCMIMGMGVRGTDTQAEIHPTTGVALTGTLLGSILVNLRFEVNEAVDCLDIGIANNSEIAYCTFTNGAAVAANGITTENCSHLHVHHCSFESGQLTGLAYGIYFGGGANKYAHNVRIHDNVIFASTAGVFIQNTCTATQCVIGPNNMIAGAAKGVDDNNGGSYVFGNYISGTDAIEHGNSSTQAIGNYVINNGTAAFESAHAT